MRVSDDIMAQLSKKIQTVNVVEIEDLPNIDLYMDQVTTFIDKILGQNKRSPEDKVLTKTMINNYTKAKIFPPPVKKKYSKTHLMLLIMIYHLKSVLSIKDIGILLYPILTKESQKEQERMVLAVYGGFIQLQKSTCCFLKAAAEGVLDESYFGKSIIDEYQNNDLQKILLVLQFSLRAYCEKILAEKILDSYFN